MACQVVNEKCCSLVFARLVFLAAAATLLSMSSASSARQVDVAVSIPPQAYFVQRIAKDKARVLVLVPPGRSPATYEPTPKQMVFLSKADVFLSIGVPFERGLIPKLRGIAPNLKIVDVTDGIPKIPGKDGNGMDPHVWLDPARAVTIARNTAKAIKAASGSKSEEIERNLQVLVKDLESLDTELKKWFAPLRGSAFFAFHPAFGYFAAAYGLKQVAVEHEGKEPGGRHLAEVIELARKRKVAAILVQAEFPTSAAQALARELGAKVVRVDPLAGDYLEGMKKTAAEIRNALVRERE